MDERAWVGIFQHPERAVGTLLHIADTMAHVPALRHLCAAMPVEDNPVERFGRHAADEPVAVPLREGLRSAVEHQIARRDHRNPIDDRLREVGPRVGLRNRHLL